VMQIIETDPTPAEILVGRVKPLRFAEKSGDYEAFYEKFNEAMASHR
jgi:uncharacterized oxidoreductase